MRKFDNFHNHLEVLNQAHLQDLENEFVISGIIDKFYIQFELGWKVLKELLNYEGDSKANSGSPREIIKQSYYCFDFLTEEIWLEMLRDRNDCTHNYNNDMARVLMKKIIDVYIPEFNRIDLEIRIQYSDVL